MSFLIIEALTKRFGTFAAVEDFSVEVPEGGIFALLGPSGCGKTTLLRLLAGFEAPDSGRMILEGNDIGQIAPHRRPVNMMFQSYALFPHLSVGSNIAFGLHREGAPRAVIESRVKDMLRLVRLEGFADRRPHQLSGGQRQRVALARALAKRPRLLLLDEPLAALDRKLREETQFELLAIQRELGLTFIIVTHDQREAMTLATTIAVMDRGRLQQIGSPQQIYDRPSSRFVAEFIGDINILECIVQSKHKDLLHLTWQVGASQTLLEHADSDCEGAESKWQVGDAILLIVRPERLDICLPNRAPPAGTSNAFPGVVAEIAYQGDALIYRIQTPSGAMLRVMRKTRERDGQGPVRGDSVVVSFPADAGSILRA